MRSWQAYVRERLGPLACAPEREAEIVEEVALQLEQVYQRARANGASDEEARAEAEAEVTDWTALARAVVPSPCRSARLIEAERVERSGLLTEIRYAFRTLRGTPGFTALVVLTLALGVGVTTATYSLVDSVLLAPLPFPDSDRLAIVQEVVPPVKDRYPVLSANLRSIGVWQNGCRTTCAAIATLEGMNATLAVNGGPQGVLAARVSANLLDVFGIRPMLGRGIQSTDVVEGSDRVLLLSYELWQQRFGADPGVIGRTVRFEGVEREIIGVLPRDPRLPRLDELTPMRRWVGEADVLVPFVPPPEQMRSPGDFSYVAVLRLRPGTTAAQAREELTPMTEAAFTDVPFRPQVLVQPLQDYVVDAARRPLWLLLGAVVMMLMVACVNVANLVAARWLARRRELAIRLSLGARPADLLRHVVAEAVCLATAGGVGAAIVAYNGLRLVVTAAPAGIPRLAEVSMDARALTFGLFVTVLCTIVSCVWPVRRAVSAPPRQMLDAGAHGASEPPASLRLRRALVGLEVAVSVMLLVVAGLLLVSFVRVNGVDRGFVTAGQVAVDLNLAQARYGEREKRTQLMDGVLAALQTVPGVDAAAVAQKLPLEGEASVDVFVREGTKLFDGPQPVGSHIYVSPEYFRALQLPLRKGRTFTDADRTRRVAVVSESTARALWPDADPIGQRFSGSRNEKWEVIGVVADTYTETLERRSSLTAYEPYWERSGPELSVVVRTFESTDAMLRAIRRAIATMDPELAALRPRTLNQVVDRAMAARRFQMVLIIAFAVAGLVIASLGTYGVVSAAVQRRRGELAVRRAVGATDGHIARTVLVEALTPVVAGLIAGAGAAVALGSIVAALLFEVSPHDPMVFAIVLALVVLAALTACAAPLVRALRTSPILALRGNSVVW